MAVTARTVYAGNTGSTLGILVDPGSTGDMQVVKLAIGTVGSETLLPHGGGVEANALRVTLASDSTGVLSVDDNGSTLSIDDGGGAITVDGTVAVSGSVTVDTELAAAAALADSTANPTIPSVGALGLLFNGTTWDRVRGDTTYGIDVDVTRMPAAARTTDSIAAALQTDAIMNGLTALTPKFASIAASSLGNNTIVAAVSSKKVRVHGVAAMANGSVNGKWQSGASGTDLTGLFYMVANTGFVLPFNPVGWFETGSATLLNLNLSAAVAVGGCLVYTEV